MCNIRKRLWRRFLCTLLRLAFSFFVWGGVVFLHVLPPRYWCRLAVSRSNNMAEWFSKNTVVAVRLLRGVTLEEADSLRLSGAAAPTRAHMGPLTDTSWGGGVSSLLGRQRKQSAACRRHDARPALHAVRLQSVCCLRMEQAAAAPTTKFCLIVRVAFPRFPFQPQSWTNSPELHFWEWRLPLFPQMHKLWHIHLH